MMMLNKKIEGKNLNKVLSEIKNYLSSTEMKTSYIDSSNNYTINQNSTSSIRVLISGMEYNLNVDISNELLSKLNKEGLSLLRNAIYAKYEYSFSDPKYREYFAKYKWYVEKGKNVENKFITIDNENINIQANKNLICYYFTDSELEKITENDLSNFILSHKKIYDNNSNNNSIFYCWYDQMISQLRMSAISKRFKKLPFKCNIRKTNIKTITNEIFLKKGTLFDCNFLNVFYE